MIDNQMKITLRVQLGEQVLFDKSLVDATLGHKYASAVIQALEQDLEQDHIPDAKKMVEQQPAAWIGLTPEDEEVINRKVNHRGGGWRNMVREADKMLREKNRARHD